MGIILTLNEAVKDKKISDSYHVSQVDSSNKNNSKLHRALHDFKKGSMHFTGERLKNVQNTHASTVKYMSANK